MLFAYQIRNIAKSIVRAAEGDLSKVPGIIEQLDNYHGWELLLQDVAEEERKFRADEEKRQRNYPQPQPVVSIRNYMFSCAICGGLFSSGAEKELCPNCNTPATRREQRRVLAENKRAKNAGREHTLTIGEWWIILKRYDFKCSYCGGEYQVLEHTKSIVDGGGTTKENCVPACCKCNVKKRSKAPDGDFTLPISTSQDFRLKHKP